MGLMDYMEDLYASLTWREVEAEAPESDNAEQSDDSGEGKEEGEAEESSEGGEGEDGDGDAAGGDDEEEEEEEEEEEDEPEDPKPKIEEECLKTAQCAPLKYHYDECAERVQKQEEENGKAEEDCVEEFFHMMHCASQCAAPKLFKQLR